MPKTMESSQRLKTGSYAGVTASDRRCYPCFITDARDAFRVNVAIWGLRLDERYSSAWTERDKVSPLAEEADFYALVRHYDLDEAAVRGDVEKLKVALKDI